MNKVDLLDLEATYFSKKKIATFSTFSIFEKVAYNFNHDWIINFNVDFCVDLSQLSKFYALCKERHLIFLVTVNILFLIRRSKKILNDIYLNSDFIRITSFGISAFPTTFFLPRKINKKTFIYIQSDEDKTFKFTNVRRYEKVLKPNRLNIMQCSCTGVIFLDSGEIVPDCKSKNKEYCFQGLNIETKNVYFILNSIFHTKERLKYYDENITEKDCNCDFLIRKNDTNFIQFLKR